MPVWSLRAKTRPTMGTFWTHCIVQNHSDRKKQFRIPRIPVDTGSEYTWVPEAILERIGVAREERPAVYHGQRPGNHTERWIRDYQDRRVFHNRGGRIRGKGDLLLLGARTLEGLNLVVNSRDKKLVAAGPIPAASLLRLPKSEVQILPTQ